MSDHDTDPPAPLSPLALAMGLQPYPDPDACPVCGADDPFNCIHPERCEECSSDDASQCDHRPPGPYDPDDPDTGPWEYGDGDCPF